MKIANVFDAEECDRARRAKEQPAPTQYPPIEESPRGQSALDPLYALHHVDNLPKPPDAATFAQLREPAVAGPKENASELAYRWAAPVELVNRLLALENLGVPQYVIDRLAALEKLPAIVETLTKRIGLLEKELDETVARVRVIQGNLFKAK